MRAALSPALELVARGAGGGGRKLSVPPMSVSPVVPYHLSLVSAVHSSAMLSWPSIGRSFRLDENRLTPQATFPTARVSSPE